MKSHFNKILLSTTIVFTLATTPVLASTTVDTATVSKDSFQMTQVSGVAGLSKPYGLLLDKQGNLIILDAGNQQIKKLEQSKLSVLAGVLKPQGLLNLELPNYKDGDASKALLGDPRFAVVDSKGTIFFTDFANHAIRKIKDGKVYTVAGSGKSGYKDGKGEESLFNSPTGIAIDSKDNLYVADTLNHVIRKITPDGVVTTFGGEQSVDGAYVDGALGKAKFNEPSGLAWDDKGNLYVSDSGNHLIRQISTTTNQVTTFAGKKTEINPDTGYMQGGYAHGNTQTARFNSPKGLTFAEGVLFVADSLNQCIRTVLPDGKVINVAGMSAAGDQVGAQNQVQFNNPVAVAYANGKLYVSDSYNHKVKEVALNPKQLKGVNTPADIIAGFKFAPRSEEMQIWMNGKQVQFQSGKVFHQSGKTYVPIRDIAQLWQAEINWNDAEQAAILSKGDVQLKWSNEQDGVVLQDNRLYVEIGELQERTTLTLVYDVDYNGLVINR
ncbi:SMP-30/gluconolactonase/LRE family protein [Paenibacillus sp. N1-5-1-14]|uniref:SMP-30/gluconolactonase/LRE family protein n=1 Tax=Paenibacillus radicibacter TaxID=2972488 RepID=UPI002158AD31|nr:SMP-30/gluconolactonase/LRE family protein [Paenibacillus radicibacter]MCR8644598.1 SMP-30/gluconolactonase/LRE family protein [Paenibacillus radicibacter]